MADLTIAYYLIHLTKPVLRVVHIRCLIEMNNSFSEFTQMTILPEQRVFLPIDLEFVNFTVQQARIVNTLAT